MVYLNDLTPIRDAVKDKATRNKNPFSLIIEIMKFNSVPHGHITYRIVNGH